MLSDIAHDLKTPITTISGYAQALRDDVVEDEQKKNNIWMQSVRSQKEWTI